MAFRAPILLLACLCLIGCFGNTKRDVGTKDEAFIALSRIPERALQHCDTSSPVPQNSFGSLLTDYNTVATKGGICAERFDTLADYIRSVMVKLRIPYSSMELPKPEPAPAKGASLPAMLAPRDP